MANPYSVPFEAPYVGLPVNQIAQTAGIIQEREDLARDQLDEMRIALRTTGVAPADQPGFENLVQNYRDRIGQIADRGFAFDKLPAIRSMARDAAAEIEHLTGNFAALSKNLQGIEESAYPQQEKALLKNLVAQSYGGSFTDEGQVDFTRGFSPRSFAEPQDVGQRAVDIAKEFLPENIFDVDVERGVMITTSGEEYDVTEMYDHIQNRLIGDPDIRGYIQTLDEAYTAAGRDFDGRELVESAAQEAIRARARDEARVDFKLDPFTQAANQRRAQAEETEEGQRYFYQPLRARNILPEDIESQIAELDPSDPQRQQLEIMYEAAFDRFSDQLPRGVTPEEFRAFREDKKQKNTLLLRNPPGSTGTREASRERMPGVTGFQQPTGERMPGSTGIQEATTDRMPGSTSAGPTPTALENYLKNTYSNYDKLKQAEEQWQEFFQGEGVRGYEAAPHPDDLPKVRRYQKDLLEGRTDLFELSEDTSGRKLDDLVFGSDDIIPSGAISYSDLFGREMNVTFVKDGKPERHLLRIKDTGQAGREGRDAFGAMLGLIGADDLIEETRYEWLRKQVGKTSTPELPVHMTDVDNYVADIYDGGEAPTPVTGKLLADEAVEQAITLAGETPRAREVAFQVMAPYIEELVQNNRDLSVEDMRAYFNGTAKGEQARRINEALSKELTLPFSKAFKLSNLMNP